MIKICICIDLNGIVTRQVLQIYDKDMALDYCQNFVSIQNLENEFMELDQILHNIF